MHGSELSRAPPLPHADAIPRGSYRARPRLVIVFRIIQSRPTSVLAAAQDCSVAAANPQDVPTSAGMQQHACETTRVMRWT